MAAMWWSLGNSPPATDLHSKREGRPNLEELWRQKQNAPLRTSFQSQTSSGSENELGYSSEGSSRKTSSEYCPATPAQCESPSIEQFYFGMDSESPTLAIGTAIAKRIDGVVSNGVMKPRLPIQAQPQMLASLTSFLDSQHDHYAAAMNAADLDQFDDYEDEVFESDYEDYEDDSSDDDFEYATIEIASIVAYSRPVLRPKLLHLRPQLAQRSPSLADSTSKYSDSSTASKLHSQYSWAEEASSDVSDHAEMVSEDEYHEASQTNELFDSKPQDEEMISGDHYQPPLDPELMFGFENSTPGLKLRFSMENYAQDSADGASAHQPSVSIPSRSSSRMHTNPAKGKSPSQRRGGRYSIFPLRYSH